MEETVIILAGGRSSRMGENKALLKLENEVTVIETILDQLKKVTDHFLIVTNSFSEYEFLKVPMIEDTWKNIGPLGGIHAGLSHSKTNNNLIVACDMPFVSGKLGKVLLQRLQGKKVQAVVPEINNQIHPLFASYRKDAADLIENLVKTQSFRLIDYLHSIQAEILSERELEKLDIQLEEKMFFNMNNPLEYQRALEINKNQMK